jgi:hypothetical protein
MTDTIEIMQVNFLTYRGTLVFAWYCNGEGLPIEKHSRAWRPYTYRRPV